MWRPALWGLDLRKRPPLEAGFAHWNTPQRVLLAGSGDWLTRGVGGLDGTGLGGGGAVEAYILVWIGNGIVFLTLLASLTVSGVLGWPSLSHSLPACSPGLLFPTPSDRVAAPVADFPRDLLGFLPHPGVCAGEIDFLLASTDCFHFIYPLWKLDCTTCVLLSPSWSTLTFGF